MDDYPRLCGGTFFTLVLQALRQRMKARDHYAGDSDGLSDSEVMVGLIKVINLDYVDPGKEKLKTIVNNYKRCETSTSVYFPFGDDQVITAFDTVVKTDYQTALNGMIDFVNDFIDINEAVHKDVNLIRALIDLIQQDQSIKASDEFYIEPSGEKKKKATLSNLKNVCLPSFLLGVWHYVVVNQKDNSVGKETYDIWCPSTGGGQRKYTAHMGEGILDGLRVYQIEMRKVTEDENAEECIEDEYCSGADIKDTQSVSSQQIVNNNPVFYNFNISGSNNNVFNHVEKLIIGNGGKHD